MRKIVTFIALSAALGLGGCATNPAQSQYGNFVQKTATINQAVIAQDVAAKLQTLYPPAKTQLVMQQTTTDPFGTALVKDLRGMGFALAELDPKANAKGREGIEGTPLSYVIDQPAGTPFTRVTVTVGKQSLTRPYVVQDGKVLPTGYWARME
jgi:hypothetical protein